jgi:hypothetical protein
VVDEERKNIQFSNSNKASFCRSFMDTRDSRLLIVEGGEQAETLRQEMKSKGVGGIKKWGAEPWTCGNRSLVARAVAFSGSVCHVL